MAFFLDGDRIVTEDGLTIGQINDGSITFHLTVRGETEELIRFVNAVSQAYEQIHPAGQFLDIKIFDNDGDTIWKGPELLLEQTEKVNGNVVRVHKNDPDNWPSDLHGHIINRPGQKIDLYTGKIFRIQGRKQIGALGKKDLKYLQDEMSKSDWAREKIAAFKATASG